ncbi:TonB family protein [Marinifilum sp. RC60d5]|uniref:TonB family protein n=1 Tax=Marinifilum sp. RC60d5 TaxID=3458414 RepID=UPI004035F468
MAFFYALYWLFLKRDTFFRVNRVFLLLTLAASLLIPSLKIPFQPETNSVSSDIAMLDALVLTSQQYLNGNMLEEVVVTAADEKSYSWYHYIGIIYFLGTFVLSLRFIKNLLQLLNWSRKNKRIVKDGIKLVVMKDNYPPFSFLNAVYISNNDFANPQFTSILAHERVHVDQMHTFDLIVLEVLSVLFWLNPFVWMYKSSLQEVHEYLADDKVVNGSVNANEYKMHIVNQFAGGELFRLANNFGQSTLKKRISMLGKIKTPKIALIKLLLLFPIFILLFSAFAFTIEEEERLSYDLSLDEFIPSELKHFYAFSSKIDLLGEQNEFKFTTDQIGQGIKSLEHKKNINPNQVYRIADVMPEYPGGINALRKYISTHTNYPKDAAVNRIEGRVFVSFVVGKQGEVKNVNVVRSVHPSLDKEAKRVVSGLGKWKPGENKNNLVNVAYTVPINFELANLIVEPLNVPEPVYSEIKNASDYHLENILKLRDVRPEHNKYVVVEKMPQFIGGRMGLKKFIARSVKYPVLAVEQGYEGRVYVRFMVNKDGSVSDAHIIKGANIELNDEALRVINSMPNWIPGEQHGTKVDVSYTIPIRFSLN